MASASPTEPTARPAFYDADEVRTILRLAKPTVYEIARTDPQRLGAVHFGRAVRFRRSVIDRIAHGENG